MLFVLFFLFFPASSTRTVLSFVISPPHDLPSSHHHCFALPRHSGLFLPRVIASAATEAKLHQPCWEPLDVIIVALFVAACRAHNNPHRGLILSGLLWQHLLGERFCWGQHVPACMKLQYGRVNFACFCSFIQNTLPPASSSQCWAAGKCHCHALPIFALKSIL